MTVHLGVADGEASQTEGPLRFNGTAVTPSNFLSGSDGPAWDDQRWSVSSALLPVGSGVASLSVTSGSDSVVWTYAALRFRL